jgi:glycosyltransferase involved in cell wall biosynthesis
MRRTDYLIVAENSSAGQKIYNNQRKRMLEELGYCVESVSFSIPTVRLTLDFLRVAYVYKKNLEEYLKGVKPEFIEFCCPATIILQNRNMIEKYKTIASFDLPFGVNMWHFCSSILHYLEKKKYHDVDMLISWTRYGKLFLTDKYTIEEEKVIWIPYTLHPDEVVYKIADDGFAISYCSKEMRRKGLDILVKAWSMIHENKKLVVAGVNKDDATLYLKKKKVKIPDNVEFAGMLMREEYLSILAKSSFFVSASRFEEFGIALLEALSYGKPVAATPTIGPSEFLREIDKNLISASFSPVDLANTIKYIEEHTGDEKIKKDIKKYVDNYNYSNIRERLKKDVLDVLH